MSFIEVTSYTPGNFDCVRTGLNEWQAVIGKVEYDSLNLFSNLITFKLETIFETD